MTVAAPPFSKRSTSAPSSTVQAAPSTAFGAGAFTSATAQGFSPSKVTRQPLSSASSFNAQALRQSLAQDPRPHYQDDPRRTYRLDYARHTINFTVRDGKAIVEDNQT